MQVLKLDNFFLCICSYAIVWVAAQLVAGCITNASLSVFFPSIFT